MGNITSDLMSKTYRITQALREWGGFAKVYFTSWSLQSQKKSLKTGGCYYILSSHWGTSELMDRFEEQPSKSVHCSPGDWAVVLALRTQEHSHLSFLLRNTTPWRGCTDPSRQTTWRPVAPLGDWLFFFDPHTAEKTKQVSANLVTNDKYNAQNQW